MTIFFSQSMKEALDLLNRATIYDDYWGNRYIIIEEKTIPLFSLSIWLLDYIQRNGHFFITEDKLIGKKLVKKITEITFLPYSLTKISSIFASLHSLMLGDYDLHLHKERLFHCENSFNIIAK